METEERIEQLIALAKRAGIVAKLTTKGQRYCRVQCPPCILAELRRLLGPSVAAIRSYSVGFSEGHRYI